MDIYYPWLTSLYFIELLCVWVRRACAKSAVACSFLIGAGVQTKHFVDLISSVSFNRVTRIKLRVKELVGHIGSAINGFWWGYPKCFHKRFSYPKLTLHCFNFKPISRFSSTIRAFQISGKPSKSISPIFFVDFIARLISK